MQNRSWVNAADAGSSGHRSPHLGVSPPKNHENRQPETRTLTTRPSMKKDWDLTQEAFDQLLAWLNPDREAAGRRYEEIRRRLLKVFACRGCACPEDLADETINRVARKVAEIAPTYVGDPAHYFCGVAHNVYLESLRIHEPEPPPKPDFSDESEDAYYECLERCMDQLSHRNHGLILEYFQKEKQA